MSSHFTLHDSRQRSARYTDEGPTLAPTNDTTRHCYVDRSTGEWVGDEKVVSLVRVISLSLANIRKEYGFISFVRSKEVGSYLKANQIGFGFCTYVSIISFVVALQAPFKMWVMLVLAVTHVGDNAPNPIIQKYFCSALLVYPLF